jgi:hypothetical protein
MLMDSEIWVLLTLALLFIKHWYVDFVVQTDAEIKGKAIWGDWQGIKHSLKQALGTFLVFGLAGTGSSVMMIMSMLDFLSHYHIDWIKMNYGNRDITNPLFWNHLGLDQLAHYLVYLSLIYIYLML